MEPNLPQFYDDNDDDFMSDKYLLQAQLHDSKLRKDRIDLQKFDTSVKNADKLKNVIVEKSIHERQYIRPQKLQQIMFEKLEEGLTTKIGEENKGFKLLQKLGFKPGDKLGKQKAQPTENIEEFQNVESKGLSEPLKPELKKNKHGISYDKRDRVKDKLTLQTKYTEELQQTFTNVKKHDFLVKKLKRKLNDCLKYLEKQEMSESIVSLVSALQFLTDQNTVIAGNEVEIGTKRKAKHEDQLGLEDLLEVLSEARVYIMQEFDYCIKCKTGEIGENPCKHFEL